MGCARCCSRRIRVANGEGGEDSATEQAVNIIDVLKTVTWREALEVLLGIIVILCFMMALVFWA